MQEVEPRVCCEADDYDAFDYQPVNHWFGWVDWMQIFVISVFLSMTLWAITDIYKNIQDTKRLKAEIEQLKSIQSQQLQRLPVLPDPGRYCTSEHEDANGEIWTYEYYSSDGKCDWMLPDLGALNGGT